MLFIHLAQKIFATTFDENYVRNYEIPNLNNHEVKQFQRIESFNKLSYNDKLDILSQCNILQLFIREWNRRLTNISHFFTECVYKYKFTHDLLQEQITYMNQSEILKLKSFVKNIGFQLVTNATKWYKSKEFFKLNDSIIDNKKNKKIKTKDTLFIYNLKTLSFFNEYLQHNIEVVKMCREIKPMLEILFKRIEHTTYKKAVISYIEFVEKILEYQVIKEITNLINILPILVYRGD
ncbi:hypothetical protein NCER_101674 [Vairimorpha ceranae BRL01]|uniref:Uncharacterized protein n=1 Tax=Vairimorpha ceranae (strain BRL01) TaxID=578460 RepID=C4VAJ4_VAIC1|nr:hypothetical protein NCER_101674 [Vairimorpha ceranae BRL01]